MKMICWKELWSINEVKWALVCFLWQVAFFGSQCSHNKIVHSIRTVALVLKFCISSHFTTFQIPLAKT